MRRATALSTTALTLSAMPFAAAAETQVDDGWHILGQIEVTETETATSWSVTKRFPAEIEGGVDAFEIAGYLIPVGWEEATRDFMLVSELGQCPFCGSGDHGTAIEVRLAEPLVVAAEGVPARIRGALHPVRDADTLQAVVMTDAVIVDG